MRPVMATVKNVKRFVYGVNELVERSHVLEGLGVVSGNAGTGKTTTIAFTRNRFNAVAVECSINWGVKDMLQDLAYELHLSTEGTVVSLQRDVIEKLRKTRRPIFLDEADKILPKRKSDWRKPSVTRRIETLREIYDRSKVPLVFIGEELSARILDAEAHFQRRITQRVEFGGLDADDVRTVAEAVCEVEVGADLLAQLSGASEGIVDRVVRGLDQVEKFARVNGLARVDLSHWGATGFDFRLGRDGRHV
jgi:DNA transposition AAA+ family ATPase